MYPDSGGQNSVRCSTVRRGLPPYDQYPSSGLRPSMKRALALLLVLAVVACATSPTGRRQLMLVSDQQMNEMGVAAFTDLKQKRPQTTDSKAIAYVNCVARNVT